MRMFLVGTFLLAGIGSAQADVPIDCKAAVAYVKFSTFTMRVMQGVAGGCADEIAATQALPMSGGCGAFKDAFLTNGDLVEGAGDAGVSKFIEWIDTQCPGNDLAALTNSDP